MYIDIESIQLYNQTLLKDSSIVLRKLFTQVSAPILIIQRMESGIEVEELQNS